MQAQVADCPSAPALLDTSSDPVLALALDATNTGLWRWDVASDRVRWSHEAYAIHGLAVGEFAGTGAAFFRLVHPGDRERVERAVRAAVRDRLPYSENFRIVRPDGSIRRVTNRSRANYEPDGSCTAVLGTITDITEYESRIDRNEEQFRAVLETSIDGFMMFESIREGGTIVDFRWTYSNETADRLTNAPRGGYVGRRLLEIHPGNRDEGLFDAYVRVVETGEPFSRELRYVRDGLELELRLAAVRVEDGFGVTFHDRGAQRRIARELDRSRQRLTLAMRVGRLGAWEYEVASGRLEFDASLLQVFGLGQDEAERLTVGWADMIHPEDLPVLLEARERAFAAGTPLDVSYRIQRPSGEVRWLAVRGEPVFDAGGALKRFVGITQDVTDRRSAERALELANLRLQEATRAADLGVHEYRPQTGELIWDERLRKWWGLGETETVTYEKFVARVHPDDRATMQAAVDCALDPSGDGRYGAEYRVIHPDGTTRWISATAQVTFVKGQAAQLVGIVQDITTVRALTDELKQADRRKDSFLAILSHELRNPLAPIRTAADIIGSPKATSQQLAAARRIIQRQVKHMAWLLDDLLDLARITRGKLALKRELTSLASVVDAAVEASRPIADARNHQLLVTLPADPVTIDVDALRLTQVLTNLLTNAAKYTDPGGLIELQATVDGGTVQVNVRDNGIGLAPEAIGQIFEMFSQLERGRDRAEGGLGIGLALVKGLVELHGGTVTAHSDGFGRGSDFRVALPVLVAPVADSGEGSGEHDGRRSGGRRVLVADDNHDAAWTLSMLLEIDGYEVRVANGGRQALSLAQTFRPDIALIDIGMPDLDGHHVARELRAHPWGARIHLIALTGWGQESDKRKATEAGFDHHLVKPVDHDELARLMQLEAPAQAIRPSSSPADDSVQTGP